MHLIIPCFKCQQACERFQTVITPIYKIPLNGPKCQLPYVNIHKNTLKHKNIHICKWLSGRSTHSLTFVSYSLTNSAPQSISISYSISLFQSLTPILLLNLTHSLSTTHSHSLTHSLTLVSYSISLTHSLITHSLTHPNLFILSLLLHSLIHSPPLTLSYSLWLSLALIKLGCYSLTRRWRFEQRGREKHGP